jgi:hypothetical protein
MRLIITVFVLFIEANAFGQLYSSYKTEGTVNTTGGPVVGNVEIILNSDSTFVIISKSYTQHHKSDALFLVDSMTSIGKWNVEGNVLKLDRNSGSQERDKFFDTYLIRRKSLERTTLRDANVFTVYWRSGELLKSQ